MFDVLGDAGLGLVAVGRLDRASTGLLLFTTDTPLANTLTDPGNGILRRYLVTVRGRLDADVIATLERGVDAPGERGRVDRLAASHIEIRKASGRETHLVVDLDEGRNREIRRLFSAVGHEVTRLHRVAFGTIEIGALAPGSVAGRRRGRAHSNSRPCFRSQRSASRHHAHDASTSRQKRRE